MLEHRDPALSVLLSAAHDANDALAVPRGGGRIYARRETGRPNAVVYREREVIARS
jgi:hypothetical protein